MAGNRQSIKPNHFYSIMSMAMVLFLAGIFVVVVLQSNQLIKKLKERVVFVVELKTGIPKEEIAKIESALNQNEKIADRSVIFNSKEAIAELMAAEMGENGLLEELPNPFLDVFNFNVKADFLEESILSNLKAEIKENQWINEVYYEQYLASKLALNIEKLGLMAITGGLIFLLIAGVIIHNTIRLSLFANRFIIRNMELVGASWGFISRPFIQRAFLNGTLAGLLAIGGLGSLIFKIQSDIPDIINRDTILTFWILLGGLLICGIIISVLSTYFVVRKYLKMRADDLY
jgi:cell division transport system permease protein